MLYINTMNWAVYIIQCSDNSYYTGISTDPMKRFQQHLTGKGAKYFNTCKPIRISYQESGHSRSSATKREMEIKNLSHSEKQELIYSQQT